MTSEGPAAPPAPLRRGRGGVDFNGSGTTQARMRGLVPAGVAVTMLMVAGGAAGQAKQGVLMESGGIYEGGIHEEGYPQGQGVLTWPGGSRFEGEFGGETGETDAGVYTWPDGTRYEGEFWGWFAVLHGVLTYPDGRRFEGDWSHGLLFEERYDDDGSGRGVGVFLGMRYEGELRDEEMHGQGAVTWPDGARYEGEFHRGTAQGRGVVTWPGGGRLEGELRFTWKGFEGGHGVMTWPDGGRYEGQLHAAKDDPGQGVYTSPDGTRYEATWVNVLPRGQSASMAYPEGVRFVCFPCPVSGCDPPGCGFP